MLNGVTKLLGVGTILRTLPGASCEVISIPSSSTVPAMPLAVTMSFTLNGRKIYRKTLAEKLPSLLLQAATIATLTHRPAGL